MRRFDTITLSVRAVATGYYELRFSWPKGDTRSDETPAPGRFLTVRAGRAATGLIDPVLRRPFAFSRYEGDEAAFIFQKRGRGTAYLTESRPGDVLDVLGPLGKGFGKPPSGVRPVLVAGGIGLGPMLYLARTLSDDAKAGRGEAPILALGARSSSLIPLSELPEGTALCTDDGSAGFKGTVADWLAALDPGLPPYYYACGPAPMMAAVQRIATNRRAPFEAAVEQWMACGVGACAGCAVALREGGYAKACSDGPVLDGHLVDWERMS